MTSPQKTKGSSFEREVAKFLSETYNESFIRAPGSGAYIGGKNQSRKNTLHEGQIRTFKGDIVPGESFKHLNAECKNYKEFPFNLVLSGDCKVLESWLDQLMTVAESSDLNILFLKITRKGKFVIVPNNRTWVTDQFLYYTSNCHKDWLIIDFDHFFKHNTELFEVYCTGSNDTKSSPLEITTSPVVL